jgi:hypothetical protein
MMSCLPKDILRIFNIWVLVALTMNITVTVFWDVAPCSLVSDGDISGVELYVEHRGNWFCCWAGRLGLGSWGPIGDSGSEQREIY